MSAEEKYDEYGRPIVDGGNNQNSKLSFKIAIGLLSDIKDKSIKNISTYEINKDSNAAVFIYDTKLDEKKELLKKQIIIKDLNGEIIWSAKMNEASNVVSFIDGDRYNTVYISERVINLHTIRHEDMICTVCINGIEDNIKILEIVKGKDLEELNIKETKMKNSSSIVTQKQDPKAGGGPKVVVPGMQKPNEPARNDRMQSPGGMQRTNETMRNTGMQRANEPVRNQKVTASSMQKNTETVRNQRAQAPNMPRTNETVRNDRVQMQRNQKINETIKSEDMKMQETPNSNIGGSRENIKNSIVLQSLKYVNTRVNVYSVNEIQNQRIDYDILIEQIGNKYVVLVKNLSLKPMYLLDQYNKFFVFDGDINEFIEKVKQIMIKMYRFTEEEFNALRIMTILDENYGVPSVTMGNAIRRIDMLKQIRDKYILIDFLNASPIIIINDEVRTEIELGMIDKFEFQNFCMRLRSGLENDVVVYDEKTFDEEQNCLLDILI